MPKRTTKLVSAVFIASLAVIPLATTVRGEPAIAADCLSEPKTETPPGSHWYYRIDHVNKRNCWYLRSEGGVSQAAPQNISPVPSGPAATKSSVADAHAELRTRPGNGDSPAVGTPSLVNAPANVQGKASWPANPSTGAATAAGAARWPDLPAASPAASGGESANLAGQPPQASAGLAKTAAASTLAYSPTPVQLGTPPTLIAAAVGALAFAGAAAVLVARRRRVRLPRHRKMSYTQAPIWETTDDDRIVIEDQPASPNHNYEPRFARGVGSAKVHAAKVQMAKVQTAKVQTAKAQTAKVHGAKVHGDRRTEYTQRTPKRVVR